MGIGGYDSKTFWEHERYLSLSLPIIELNKGSIIILSS